MEVYEKIKRDLFFVLLIVAAMNLAWRYLPIGRDDTDGITRSGVSIHVDNLTGCEYLGGPNGGVTPRLDAAGKHICGR